MHSLNIYLTFNGNCEEAFRFYETTLGGKADFRRFKDMPENPDFSLTKEDKEKVMHVALVVNEKAILMGSDTGGEWSAGFKQGNNFSISMNAESKEEADRIFNGLSHGGKVIMPMNTTFWNSYFGMFTDKFGIQWMVSYDAPDRVK